VEITVQLGTLLFEVGRVEQAATTLARAVELAPDDAPLRTNLANVRLAQGRGGEAEALARSAIARAPGLDAAHGTLALALSSRGDHGGALDALRTAMRLNPDDPRYAVNAALELAALGRAPEACDTLSRAARAARDEGLARDVAERRRRLSCP
jgi:tetratricopeptide (TPR) repeat protein